MALYLVNPGVEMTLELFVSDRIENAVALQFERITDSRVRDIFVRKLEKRLDGLLGECLDWDLKEPTEAQLAYATVIAQQLNIPVPSEARLSRFHMALFLEAYASKAKEARNHGGRAISDESGAAAAKRLVELREAAMASVGAADTHLGQAEGGSSDPSRPATEAARDFVEMPRRQP